MRKRPCVTCAKRWGCPIASPMSGHIQQDHPSLWVSRFASLIPQQDSGLTLDLACGGGRHTRLLAALGHAVLAVDRDAAALLSAQGGLIRTQSFDLEQPDADSQSDWPLQPQRFCGIVVTNYLHRPLMPALFNSLSEGGILIYETFAQGNGQFGKPSNPDFLLAPGELLGFAAQAPGFRVLAYEDGYLSSPKPAMVQRICVRRDSLHPSAASPVSPVLPEQIAL